MAQHRLDDTRTTKQKALESLLHRYLLRESRVSESRHSSWVMSRPQRACVHLWARLDSARGSSAASAATIAGEAGDDDIKDGDDAIDNGLESSQ